MSLLNKIQKLSKTEMKAIKGGENHIVACTIDCSNGSYTTSSCDEQDGKDICSLWHAGDLEGCSCEYSGG